MPKVIARAAKPVRRAASVKRAAAPTHATLLIGGQPLSVGRIGVGEARNQFPRLIREASDAGMAWHIQNTKNPTAASAFLVSRDALERLVVGRRSSTLMAEVLDRLPFKDTGVTGLRVAVPGNRAPTLRVPDLSDPGGP